MGIRRDPDEDVQKLQEQEIRERGAHALAETLERSLRLLASERRPGQARRVVHRRPAAFLPTRVLLSRSPGCCADTRGHAPRRKAPCPSATPEALGGLSTGVFPAVRRLA